VRFDPTAFDPEAERGVVKEYRLSEIGRYLLIQPDRDPQADGRLRSTSHAQRLDELDAASAAEGRRPAQQGGRYPIRDQAETADAEGPDLDVHFHRMVDELRSFEPFGKKMARLEARNISN